MLWYGCNLEKHILFPLSAIETENMRRPSFDKILTRFQRFIIEKNCKNLKNLACFPTDVFHVYHIFHGNYSLRYSDAANKCKENGYPLAMPKTLKQQQMMENQIRTVTQGLDWRMWIGFTGSAKHGFTWSDGESVGWTYWWAGQPNSGSQKSCGEIVTSASWAWNDNECWRRRPFICQEIVGEMAHGEQKVQPSAVSKPACDCGGQQLLIYNLHD